MHVISLQRIRKANEHFEYKQETDDMTITPTYVLVTDAHMFRPTMFTAYRLLTQTAKTSILHFWGSGLDESDWSLLDQLVGLNPKVQIIKRDISNLELQGAKHVGSHVTPAAMGRLLIPSKLNGRVLYLDGDLDVVGDLSEIFEIDLRQSLIAGVKDFVVTRRNHNKFFDKNRNEPRTVELRSLLSDGPISSYINSGVLLMDTDRIKEEPVIYERLSDLHAASKWSMGDQDHINNLFQGKIYYLNPAWNASWGRSIEHRFLLRRFKSHTDEVKYKNNKIIHFHGANKPWKRKAWKFWKTYDRSIISYRIQLKKYEKSFPMLAFSGSH